MKEQIIQIPDTLEIKEIKDGKIILVEKEKKLAYEDIVGKLFPDTEMHYCIDSNGYICRIKNNDVNKNYRNNATSKKQAKKLLAINMLMNVAKYLNGNWQPDWNNRNEFKYSIIKSNYYPNQCENLIIDGTINVQTNSIYFKSRELTKKAIEILGEEVIKLALCTDY